MKPQQEQRLETEEGEQADSPRREQENKEECAERKINRGEDEEESAKLKRRSEEDRDRRLSQTANPHLWLTVMIPNKVSRVVTNEPSKRNSEILSVHHEAQRSFVHVQDHEQRVRQGERLLRLQETRVGRQRAVRPVLAVVVEPVASQIPAPGFTVRPHQRRVANRM
ncbi:hypothetical protein EYF80_012674 [Liparis tanakae]|uniref:Uncharacterized protein n=1 Tax=Liparis tanakae TaxID=230148 RepID=A0A4Z2IGA0_9TELE|nr:hypothetical protein EYF80_012674 [Liparis tanakae]